MKIEHNIYIRVNKFKLLLRLTDHVALLKIYGGRKEPIMHARDVFSSENVLHSSIAIILMGKRELVALLNLSSWCLLMVERLFLTVPRGCLRFVIVVIPDHTHLLFMNMAPSVYLTHFTCTNGARNPVACS